MLGLHAAGHGRRRGWAGLGNEARLSAEVSAARTALDAQQTDAANMAYANARKLADDLHSTSARVQLQAFAEHDERVQNTLRPKPTGAKSAAALKANPAEFAPLQRVQCAQGDSLPVWRRLLFEGFPAVVNPDLTPGLMRLGQIAGDVRAKLLPALAAWELERPAAERRELLEAVQKVAPNEPTSANLLRRLGVKFPTEKLWLPFELIVGKETTIGGLEGTIEELGEMRTLVFLNEGHWEMLLRASGTPLHEEWPIIRVEINGQVLGPTQVNKAQDYDVPFTFDVLPRRHLPSAAHFCEPPGRPRRRTRGAARVEDPGHRVLFVADEMNGEPRIARIGTNGFEVDDSLLLFVKMLHIAHWRGGFLAAPPMPSRQNKMLNAWTKYQNFIPKQKGSVDVA